MFLIVTFEEGSNAFKKYVSRLPNSVLDACPEKPFPSHSLAKSIQVIADMLLGRSRSFARITRILETRHWPGSSLGRRIS